MYLLDTKVCIDFLKARSPALAKRMDAAFGRLAISAVTFAELAVGSRRSDNPIEDARRIDAFAAALDILPFDESTGRAYATAARALGVRRKSFDLLIGAHALSRDLTLVTANERDFADIRGLRIENWTA